MAEFFVWTSVTISVYVCFNIFHTHITKQMVPSIVTNTMADSIFFFNFIVFNLIENFQKFNTFRINYAKLSKF